MEAIVESYAYAAALSPSSSTPSACRCPARSSCSPRAFWSRPAGSRWSRPSSSPLRDPVGRAPVSLEGHGPAVKTTFFGTGFLVSRDGAMLTSRHVVEPWKGDEEIAAILGLGVRPRVVVLRAFFPGEEGQSLDPAFDGVRARKGKVTQGRKCGGDRCAD